MATSLQKQLNFLKTQETKQDRQFKDNERPSMLFSFRVAASYSVRQIKEIALEGFANFSHRNPSFSRFRTLLFDNEAHNNLDREKLSKTDNDKLSGDLEEVLLALSQHLNNVDVLKILEYLLRNFDVHKFQSDFLLINFLHFHSTSQYTKLLQNIELNNTYNWYSSLNDPVIRGDTIDRRSLVKRYLKLHPKILEDLLDVNLRHFDQVKRFNDSSSVAGYGYYISNGSSNIGKIDVDSQAFRFFCALYIEYFETHKSKEILTLPKELLFRSLVYMVNNNAVGLLNGNLMLCSFNLINNKLHREEISTIMTDLLNFTIDNSDTKTTIANFFLFVISYSAYELDIHTLKKIGDNLLHSLLGLKDQYSLCNLLVKYLKGVTDKSTNQPIQIFNDLHKYIFPLLSVTIETDVNYNIKSTKTTIIDQIANIFIYLSDNNSLIDKQTLENYKELKNAIISDVQQFLSILTCKLNSKLLSTKDQEMKTSKIRYKKDIELIFGNITYYGMFDVELLESGMTSSLLGYKRLAQLSEDDKFKYCTYISSLITDKPTTVKDKENLSQVLTDFMISTTNLPLIIEVLSTSHKLRKDKELQNKLVTLFIHKCFNNNIIIPHPVKKQLQDIITIGKDDPSLLRAFDTLILNLNENSVTYFNDIKRRIDCILDLDYDSLINLIAYFTLYDPDKRLVPKAIITILDSPLKFRIQNNNFDEYSSLTIKILNVTQLINSANILDVAVKSVPRIITKIVKDLVNFYYHGKPTDKFTSALEEISIKAINLVDDKSDIDEVIKSIDENYFMFLVGTFLLKNTNKYTSKYLAFLCELCEYTRVSKFIKNWGRFSKELVTFALVFLNNITYSDKIEIETAKTALTLIKNLSLAFNEYTIRELNKKSKKANILKDIMVIVIKNLHNFADETRYSLLRKLRTELTKSVETSLPEFIEFFTNATRLPDAGLKTETVDNYIKSLTICSGLNIDVTYDKISDLYTQITQNTNKLLSNHPNIHISQLVENLLIFYLKNGDYVNYFEVYTNFHTKICSDSLLRELKRYISSHPDYIKVITFFYLYKLDNLLYLDDFKFDYAEIFLLVRTALQNNSIELTEHLIRNILNYLSNLQTPITHVSIVSLFGVLKACLSYLNSDIANKNMYIFELIGVVVTILKKYNKQYSFKDLDGSNIAMAQEDKLNLSLSTIINHITQRADSNDIFIDFYQIDNKNLHINPSYFISVLILSDFESFLKGTLSEIINKPLIAVDPVENIDSDERTEETTQATKIKTVFEYMTLFINVKGSMCFDIITAFFDNFKVEYKNYRNKLVSSLNNDHNKYPLSHIGSSENFTYENSADGKRLEDLVSRLYFTIFEMFKTYKIKKRDNKLMVLVLSYLNFGEFRLKSGLITHLSAVSGNKHSDFKKTRGNISYIIENLKTIFIDVFGNKNSFSFIYALVYYFSMNFQTTALREFIDIMSTVVIDVYANDSTNNSGISNSINKLVYDINNFIIANFMTTTDLDFDYHVSNDIIIKKKFMNNQDMINKFAGEANLNAKLLKRRLLIIISNFANHLFESKIYNDDLNEQIIYKMDNEASDIEFLKNNAAVFISFVISFKKIKEFNKQSIESGNTEAFTSKMLKSIEDFKNISIRLIPVELYLMMLGDITTQIKNNKNSELVLYSLLNIIIEKISKVTLSKLFKQLLVGNISLLNQMVFDEHRNIKSERLIQNYLILLTNILEISPQIIESIIQNETNMIVDIFELIQKNENPIVIVTGLVFFAKLSTYFKKQLIPLFNRLQKFFCKFVISMLDRLDVKSTALSTLKSSVQFSDISLKNTKSHNEVLAAILEYLYVIYVNFTNMMSPFVNQHLQLLSILNDNFELNQISDVITSIVTNVEFRILIKELQSLVSTIDPYALSLFTIISDVAGKTFQKLDYDSFVEHNTQLFQILINALKTCERIYTSTSQNQVDLWSKWTDSFLAFILKCNEKQLKQYVADLKKQFIFDKISINNEFRRYLYFKVQNRIMSVLGSMAIGIYGESFDMINDTLDAVSTTTSSLIKREDKEHGSIYVNLHQEVIESLVLLTKSDNSTMIDLHTFETLSKSLIKQITDFRLLDDKKELVDYFNNHIFEALSHLMRCRNDEYQIKAVLNQIFKLLRDTRKFTRYLAILGLKNIIGNLQELFLVYVNDVTPRLSYVLEDEDPRIAKVGREIINLLQDITGDNIEEYVRDSRPNFEE